MGTGTDLDNDGDPDLVIVKLYIGYFKRMVRLYAMVGPGGVEQ